MSKKYRENRIRTDSIIRALICLAVFVLPGDVKKLTIHCYAFTYSVGDLQVDYCLEGFDHEPVTVNRSELGPVSYTNLPGGSYRFVMTLSNALKHDEKSISVSIEKKSGCLNRSGLSGAFSWAERCFWCC